MTYITNTSSNIFSSRKDKEKNTRCVYTDIPCVFYIPYSILTIFKLAVSKYIHSYNHKRFQKKKLNNLSPYKFGTQIASLCFLITVYLIGVTAMLTLSFT
ncbi:hypothetical protein COF47_19350 [Bacillus wiedmannii]|nr:hypothetical protein COF47_19350 [Bacillus wiedmannii]